MKMLWKVIDLAKEAELVARFDGANLQNSFLFRSLYRARKISEAVIDCEGNLLFEKVRELIEAIKRAPLPIYPNGGNDFIVARHFLKTLSLFSDQKGEWSLLKRFSLPLPNRYSEELIRASLGATWDEPLTTAHFRRAVLSALLTPLRQNVGSCFATAPAILIQREQQERLLIDLYDLLSLCHLKRTFNGVEHTVPICTSWGCGDLKQVIDFNDRSKERSLSLQAVLAEAELKPSNCPSGVMSIEMWILKALSKRYGISLKAINTHKRRIKSGEQAPPMIERLLTLETRAQSRFKSYTDHALLKTWEFTLASFSDYKIEFYRWNLYASLGLDPEEAGGIGALLYERISEQLEQSNGIIKEHEEEHNRAMGEAQVSQTLMRNAISEDRLRSLKAQLTVQLGHARACKELVDRSHQRATHLSTLFQFLIESFMRAFPDYFQEVYDPEMFDLKADLYDDRKAGFRLVYKHGRNDPALWTPIFDALAYQKHLAKFFTAIEPELIASCDFEEGEKEISHLITALVHHLQTDTFLASALERMARKHKVTLSANPLAAQEELEKKPWSYTSGGTVHTLIKCYYCIEGELTEEKKNIATPMELLIFMLDTLKGMAPRITRRLEEDDQLGLLMYSPQHVFLLHPGLAPFKEGWLERSFSYTWARDQVLLPQEHFYRNLILDQSDQHFLAHTFLQEQLHSRAAKLEHLLTFQNPSVDLPTFRNHLLQKLSPFFQLRALSDNLDAFLRIAFPFFSPQEAHQAAKKLLAPSKKAHQAFEQTPLPSRLTYAQLYRLLLSAVAQGEGTESALVKAITKEALGPPPPLLFADTNWSHYYFAFALNPGTLELELWRVNRLGTEGFPMSSWAHIFSEQEKNPWGLFTSLEEQRTHRLIDRSWLKA